MIKTHKQLILALPIAILSLVASFFFWTYLLTGTSIENAEASSVHFAAELTVHPSSDEVSQWGLRHMWKMEVPSLGIEVPVYLPSRRYWDRQQWNLLEEQMQVGMNQGTVAYPHSVDPGMRGALLIAGHSSPPTESAKQSAFGNVFEKLPDITIGSSIFLDTDEGRMEYIVERTEIVSPEETDLLTQEYGSAQLKLITCFPVGTTKDRFVVVAKMKENK